MENQIRFMKHFVTDGVTKARVWYSASQTQDGKKYVTLYEKDYQNNLGKIFENAQNDTETMTDYFEKDRVRFFENDAMYSQVAALAK